MQTLDLRWNKLTEIPVGDFILRPDVNNRFRPDTLLSQSNQLAQIWLKGNVQLSNPPYDSCSTPQLFEEYVGDLLKGSQQLDVARILLIGHGGAGKTSFARQLLGQTLISLGLFSFLFFF